MNSIIHSSMVTLFVLLSLGLSQAQAQTPAVDDSAANEAMREQFNNRWFEAKVPDYLKKRMNEEAAFSGPTEPAALYKEIMDHDFKPVPKKLSELVDPKVYSSLQRQMNSKHLVDVLKAGKIEPSEYQVGANEEETSQMGVYLELHTFAHPKPFDWGDVELHFSNTVLDREDYHMSPYWDFGYYGPFAATPSVNKSRIAYYITSYLPKQEQNEFVFINPVSVKDITQIVVVKGKRAALLAEIKKQKVVCPQEGGCEKLIVERAQ